jgi:hypothetical protein
MYLHTKEWLKLNELLSSTTNCKELATDPIFSVFENNLLSEIKRYENDGDEDLSLVLARIFQLSQSLNILKLSDACLRGLAEYLFQKHPSEHYAKYLIENEQAQSFLKRQKVERTEKIEKTILASNLNIKVGDAGELDFSKSIFNSPQEKELYFAAKKILPNEIILPNVALSSIINSKIVDTMDQQFRSHFFSSTLDLCVISSETFLPKMLIELDSSWHDSQNQIHKDEIKNQIFSKAGLKLHRLRKIQNKSMEEIFELYIKNNYVC